MSAPQRSAEEQKAVDDFVAKIDKGLDEIIHEAIKEGHRLAGTSRTFADMNFTNVSAIVQYRIKKMIEDYEKEVMG